MAQYPEFHVDVSGRSGVEPDQGADRDVLIDARHQMRLAARELLRAALVVGRLEADAADEVRVALDAVREAAASAGL